MDDGFRPPQVVADGQREAHLPARIADSAVAYVLARFCPNILEDVPSNLLFF